MTNSVSQESFIQSTKEFISMLILTSASIASPFIIATNWNISNLESTWHLILIPISIIIYILLSSNARYFIAKYKKTPHNSETFKGSAFYMGLIIGVIAGSVIGIIGGLYFGAVTEMPIAGIIWGPICGISLTLIAGLGMGLSTELSSKENV